MCKKYLLRFTPLEPYFLGGENTFRVDEANRYFASSLPVPTASTIIGALRYMLLELTGTLNTDGRYTDEQKAACDAVIGPKSYRVGGDNNFGKLLSVSPVFLTDGKDFYIKTPRNCKSSCTETQYQAIALSTERYTTSFATPIRLPLAGEFSAKNTVSDQSYMRLSDGLIFNDLFLQVEKVGISKAKLDKAFFKKAYISLKEGFSFAVIAEFEDDVLVQDTFCYMGRERSVFLLKAEPTDISIEEEIQTALAARTNTTFYYVFGDTFVQEQPTFSDYAMFQTAHVRILQSKIERSTLRVTCANEFYHLIRAGSICYADDIRNNFENNYGYNKIIKVEV